MPGRTMVEGIAERATCVLPSLDGIERVAVPAADFARLFGIARAWSANARAIAAFKARKYAASSDEYAALVGAVSAAEQRAWAVDAAFATNDLATLDRALREEG
jgi:hypothetical protein